MLQPISFDPEAGTNVDEVELLKNVFVNIRRQLPQVWPHQPNPEIALLVCGGPSLAESIDELKEAYFRGGKIVTVNGAYRWCLDHNLKPSATVVMDGREFNSRFVDELVPNCKYLLASQCHPTTFDICKGRDVHIWHTCSGGERELEMIRKYYFGRTNPITIGTTVAIRAISLLRMLGFLRMETFGLDSCWMDGDHHAYWQPENDGDQRIQVSLRPTKNGVMSDIAHNFICAPWHIRQAEDFKTLTQQRGDLLQLNVHGRGLIATMIKTGADLAKSAST